MTRHFYIRTLTAAAVLLSAAALAAPEDVPQAQVGSHQKPLVLESVTTIGSTDGARALPLDRAEAARPVASELPQVDEQAWLPQGRSEDQPAS